MQEPTQWAKDVEHAMKTIAHRAGSYKNKKIHMAEKNMGNSNLIGPDQ